MAAVQLLAVTARSPNTLVILKSTNSGSSWTALPMTSSARTLGVTAYINRDECDILSWNSDRSILAIAGSNRTVRFVAVTEAGADLLRSSGGTAITIPSVSASGDVVSVAWHPRLDRLYVGISVSPWLLAYTYDRSTKTFTNITFPNSGTGPSDTPHTLSFTASGSHLAVQDKGVYRLSSTGNSTFQSGSPDGGFGALSFSRNGLYLISDDTIYDYVDGGGSGDSWTVKHNLGNSATIYRSAFNFNSTRVLLSSPNTNWIYNVGDGQLYQTIDPAVSGYSDITWETDGLGFLIGKTNAGTLYRGRTLGGPSDPYTETTFNIPELVLVNTAGTSDLQLAPSIHSVVLGKYVEPGYGAAGYFNDGTIVGLNTFVVSGTMLEFGEILCSATATQSTQGHVTFDGVSNVTSTATHSATAALTRGAVATLTTTATASILAGYLQSGSTAIAGSATVSPTGVITARGQSSISSQATQTTVARVDYDESLAIASTTAVVAQARQTHRPTIAVTGAATFQLAADVLVLQDALLSAVSTVSADADVTFRGLAALPAVASLVATGRFPVNHEAQADLSSTATQSTLGGRLIEPNELYAYSWDELSQWVEWPFEEWEPRGVFMLASGFQVTLGGELPTGAAGLTATATVTTLAGYLLTDSAVIQAQATVTSGSSIQRPGQAQFTATATVTVSGRLTTDIDLTLFDDVELTAQARLVTVGQANLATVATVAAVGLRRPGGVANLATVATVLAQGNYLRQASANLSAFYSTLQVGTIFKVDEYRIIPVPQENRIWTIAPESRQVPVRQTSRRFLVEGYIV